MIEYKKATVEEYDILAKIRVDFLTEVNNMNDSDTRDVLYRNNQEYFLSSLNDGTFASWLAVEGENIVAASGVAYYTLPPNASCPNGKIAYINNMFTYTQYRKKGIASRLFELIVEEARLFGCTKILLNATDMGRPIYEKYGFEYVENDMVYYVR